MLLEVGEVFLHQRIVTTDDEQVLGILLLCSLREVERYCGTRTPGGPQSNKRCSPRGFSRHHGPAASGGPALKNPRSTGAGGGNSFYDVPFLRDTSTRTGNRAGGRDHACGVSMADKISKSSWRYYRNFRSTRGI